MYCNVELFAAVDGVDLPDASWDWDQFVQAGKELTRDTDGDGRIDTWATVVHRWPPVQIWIWQAGGHLFDPDTGQLDLTSPAVLRGAKFKADLIHRYRIAPPVEQIDAGIHDLFRAGRVAMFFGGAADDLDRQEGLQVAVRQIPAGPGGRATFAWSAGLCISPGVADRDQAIEVYARLLTGLQQWKVPAPRRSLAARLEQIEPRKAHAAEVIRAAMEHMRPPHSLPESARFDDLFWEEFESPLLHNRARAEDLAEAAQSAIRDQL
jgi:multiple sugar transport system substrate-binding protein